MSLLKNLKARLPGTRVSARKSQPERTDTTKEHMQAPDLDKLLVIPVSKEPREEQMRSYHFNQGQFLARQERWDDLTTIVTK